MASVPIYRAEPCPTCHNGTAARTSRLWQNTGISRYDREAFTFQAFDPAANPGARLALEAATAWATACAPPFLVLHSQTKGTGKTHLAVAAAAVRIERGESVAYHVTARLLDQLRFTQRPDTGEDLTELRLQTEIAPVLILDDLGAQRETEWGTEQLATIIDRRYSHRRPTLITTNMDLEQLDERIRSRITDRATSLVIHCAGSDYRARRPGMRAQP